MPPVPSSPRRRVDPAAGRQALDRWLADPENADRTVLALAVRFTLDELAVRHPGRSTEVRVPPYAAVQVVTGPRHTRGTPPNVVEADPQTWLRLATGALDWAQAVGAGGLRASGERSDLSTLLPIFRLG